MRMRFLLKICLPFVTLVSSLVFAGCGGQVVTSSPNPSQKTLSSITVTPATASIAVGATQQFTAMATYSDSSTANVTSSVTWTSSDTAAASVNASGLATAIATGTATITASLNSANSTAALTITAATAPPPTLTSIAVTPPTASIAVGANQQFTATATYSDNSTKNVTSTVTWTSGATGTATINAAGLATGVAAGSATITASLSGVSSTAALTVTASSAPPPTISSISVTPPSASIAVGATQQFTATATYSDNSTANVTSSAIWTSSSTATATVNSAGLATGVAAGSATITASLSGVSGTAALTVTAATAPPPTITSISVTPPSASIAVGATQQFTATATYSNGSTANVTTSASWTSAATGTATVNSSGLATGVAAGSTTITASLSGFSSSAALTVTASSAPPPTISSISVTPPSASVAVGATQQYTATATYSNGSTANVTTSASWTSGATGTATVNSSGLATGVAAGSTTITASLSGVSGTAQITVTSSSPSKTVTSIAVTPAKPSFAMGSTEQFTATATYSDGSTGNVSSTATWTSSNTSVATIDATGLATGVASGSTTITATLDSVSGSTLATVTIAAGTGVNIPTWHVDANRSGLNSGEQSLTPSNVSPQTFGKLFSYLVDGYAYAEPLLMSNITINGAKHNVLYVATEADMVYAFDADSGNQTPLWSVSLLQSGETPLTTNTIQPYTGVTATPVIDTSTNTMYVVSEQTNGQTGGGTYRLSALDITTGAQKFGGPVTLNASVAGTNATAGNGTIVTLTTACLSRAALLEANGNIYIGIASCPTGWLLAYNATTLAQVGVFNSSPNLAGEGQYASAGGIWMGGGGPVADSAGNVYVTTGNGPWDGQSAWSDSVLRFPPTPTAGPNGTMQPADYFTPDVYAYMNCNDADLAAGGLLLIPGTTTLVSGGKTGMLFLNNAQNLGHEQANDAGVESELWFESDLIAPYSTSCTDSSGTHDAEINSYEIFGTSAYYNGYVYLGITPTSSTATAPIRQFQWNSSALTLTPGAYTSPNVSETVKGTTPFISSNGNQNGIVWMIDQGTPLQAGTPTSATLRAYDAEQFPNELYNSSQNSGDTPGYGIKFTSPIVANGKVYISTGHDPTTVSNPQGEIDVYGLH